jgi:hypothetical protein
MLCCLQVIASCSHRAYIHFSPHRLFSTSSSSSSSFFSLICYCCTEGKSDGGTRHHPLQKFLLFFQFFFWKKKTVRPTEHTKEDENAFCIYIYISGLRRRKHKAGTLKNKKKKKKKGRREIIIWIKLWLHGGGGTLQKYSSHFHSYSRFQSLAQCEDRKNMKGENIGAWQQHTSCLPALCTGVSYLV